MRGGPRVRFHPAVSDGQPSRGLLAFELLLTAVGFAVLFPALADIWGGAFTELAARIEHGAALTIVWPLEQARAMGWFEGAGPLGVVPWVVGLGGAFGLTALAAAFDTPPNVQPERWRRVVAVPWSWLVGPPLLIATGVTIFAGAGLDPAVFGVVLAAGAIGGSLGRSSRGAAVPWERSLSGLPPASLPTDHILRLCLLWAGISAILAVSALGGVPFEQAPLKLARTLERSTLGPAALTWLFAPVVLVVVLLAPHTRRAFTRMSWEPWLAGLVGLVGAASIIGQVRGMEAGRDAAPLGFALGFLGASLAAAGVPWLPLLSANPLRSVGRLWLPLVSAVAVILHLLATGFLGCPTLVDDPRIKLLSDVPAPSAVAWTGGERPAVFAAWKGEGAVMRIDLTDGDVRVLGAASLQVGQGSGGARVRPSLLGEGPDGHLFVLSDVLRDGRPASTMLMELDPSDAGLLALAEESGDCEVATWGWNPLLNVGIVGCRQSGDVLLYEPSMGEFIARQELVGSREVQAVAVDPIDGAALTLARRKSPFLIRYDLEARKPRAWRFLGTGNFSLLLGDDGLLRVPRFLGRQVLSLDPVTLEPLATRHAGFALGPIEDAPAYGRVVTASFMDGHLYAVDAGNERPTERLRVGGWVRDLDLGGDGRTLFAAGMCGVMAVDLEAWLR